MGVWVWNIKSLFDELEESIERLIVLGRATAPVDFTEPFHISGYGLIIN